MTSKPLVKFSIVATAVAGMALAGCSSSSKPSHHESTATATQKVCQSRTQLSNTVSTVVSDVQAGNLTKAKDEIPAVKHAVKELHKNVDSLKTSQKNALSSDVNKLKSSVAGLKNAKSLSELSSGIDSVKSQAQSLETKIQSTLSCP
jgi:outer membrane murein-binding lipoprotein Lpp